MTTAHTHPDIQGLDKQRRTERWRQDQLGPNPEIPVRYDPLAEPGELEGPSPAARPSATGSDTLLDAAREPAAPKGQGDTLLDAVKEPPQKRGYFATRFEDEYRHPRSPDKLYGLLGRQRKKWLHPELVKEVGKLPGPVRGAFYDRAAMLIFGAGEGVEVDLTEGGQSVIPAEKLAKLAPGRTHPEHAWADEVLHLGQLGADEETLRPYLRSLARYRKMVLAAGREAEMQTANIKNRQRRTRMQAELAQRKRRAAVAEWRKENKRWLKPMAAAGGAVDVWRGALVGMGAGGLKDTGPRDEKEATMRGALEPETGARLAGEIAGVATLLHVAPGVATKLSAPAAWGRVGAGAVLGGGRAVEAGTDREIGMLIGAATFGAFEAGRFAVGRFKNIRALAKKWKIPYSDAKKLHAAAKARDAAEGARVLRNAHMKQMVPEIDQKSARAIQRLVKEGDRLARQGAKTGVSQMAKEAQLDRRAAQIYQRARAKAEVKGLYAQLGVGRNASPEQIEAAFARFIETERLAGVAPTAAERAEFQSEARILRTGTPAQKAKVRTVQAARRAEGKLTPPEAMKTYWAYQFLRNRELRAKYDAGQLTPADWQMRPVGPVEVSRPGPRALLPAPGQPVPAEAAAPTGPVPVPGAEVPPTELSAAARPEASYEANLKAAAAGVTEFRSPRVAWSYVVHPSARQPGQWQVTTMGEGEPSGHYEFSTKEAAIASISGKAVEGPAIGDGTWIAAPTAPEPTAVAAAEAKVARATVQRQGRKRKTLERELVTYYEGLTGEDIALARERVEAGTPDAEQYGFDSFKTTFAGKVPTELAEALQGQRRLRMMVKGNVAGATGEDFLKTIGTDRYVEGLGMMAGGVKGDVERAIAWLEETVKGDVPNADIALKLKRYRALQAGGPRAVEDVVPKTLQVGDRFTSEGEQYDVTKKKADGTITIENGARGEIQAGATITIDKGSLTRAAPTTDVGPFTDAVGKELGATAPGAEPPAPWAAVKGKLVSQGPLGVVDELGEERVLVPTSAKEKSAVVAAVRKNEGAEAAGIARDFMELGIETVETHARPGEVVVRVRGLSDANRAALQAAEGIRLEAHPQMDPAPDYVFIETAAPAPGASVEAPTPPTAEEAPTGIRPPKRDLLGQTYVEPIRGKQKELLVGTEGSPERILGPAHTPRPAVLPPTEVKPGEMGAKLPGVEPAGEPPPAKEPWETPASEWIAAKPERARILAAKEHFQKVRAAVASEKPVPRQVLREYATEDWAKEALAKMEGEPKPAKVKMMITGTDRADLKAMGYTGKQIAKLTPAGAQKVLDASRGGPSGVEASRVSAELPDGPMPGTPEAQPGAFARLWARVKRKLGRKTDITPRAIILRMSETYGQAIRTGRLRARTASGTYAVREELVRLRNATSIPTAAHELGHHLQKTLWPAARTPIRGGLSAQAFPRKLWKEIVPLAYPKAKTKTVEGFAEFVRLYLTEPAKALRAAPNTYRWFEQQLKLHKPEIADALLQTRSEIQAYITQAPKAKVLAQLSVGQRGPRRMSLETIVTVGLDKYEPLRRAVKTALGTDVPITEDFYKLARLYEGAAPGRALAALCDGIRDYNDPTKAMSEPLLKILKPVSDKLDDLRAYLVARRSLELNNRGVTTGIHARDASATVQGFAADAEITTAAEGIYKFQDAFVDYLVDAGLLAEDHAGAMRQASKAYVPFYRVFEEIAPTGGMGGKKFVNLPQAIRKIKGSGRPIVDPLESIVRNVWHFTALVEKNRVALAIVRATEAKEGLGWLAIKAKKKAYPTRVTLDEMFEMMKKFGIVPESTQAGEPAPELTAYVNIFRASMYPSAKENIGIVFRKGEPELWQFDAHVHTTLSGMGEESVGMFVRLLAKPASWLRIGATMTPDFIMRNALRDSWTAALYSNYNFVPVVDVARGVFHAAKQDKLYWDWQAAGGAHGQLVSVDRKVLQDALRRVTENPDWMDHAWGLVTRPWRWMNVLRGASERIEEATRLGEYAKAPKRTVRETLDAAFSARELTVDFKRAGTGMKIPNRVAAFLNANVQGKARMFRAFRQHPGRTTAKGLCYITVPSMILYAINRDREDYWELPAWRRTIFWNIPVGGGEFISIPKAFAQGMLFGSLPESILTWIDKKDPSALNEWAKEIKRDAIPSVIPTAFMPFIEWAANYSFFRERAIVPESEQRRPPEQQYGPWTSETAKEIGQRLKASPRKLDNAISSWFGGMGRYATDLSDVALGLIARKGTVPKPLRWWERVPGLKTFFTQAYRTNSDSIDDFYTQLAEAEVAAKRASKKVLPGLADRIRARTDLGKKAKAKHLKDVAEGRVPSEYLPEAVVVERDRLRFAALRLRYLRKRTKEILADPLMPSSMKAEQMQKFAFEMIQAARAGVGRPKLKNMAEALALPEGEATLKKINKAAMSKAHALASAGVSAVRGKALVRSLQDAGIGLAQAKELIREHYRLRPLKEPTKRSVRAKRDKTVRDRLHRLTQQWSAAGGLKK